MASPNGGIKRIVVGVDGSTHAAAALQWAMRMATGMGSEVIPVFAITSPVPLDLGFGPPAPQLDDRWRAEMKTAFEDDWCRPLRDAHVRYRPVIDDGRAASVIARVADDNDADVVVVGRRGRGGVAELLLGSVSHELVLQSRRPVLVISPPPKA